VQNSHAPSEDWCVRVTREHYSLAAHRACLAVSVVCKAGNFAVACGPTPWFESLAVARQALHWQLAAMMEARSPCLAVKGEHAVGVNRPAADLDWLAGVINRHLQQLREPREGLGTGSDAWETGSDAWEAEEDLEVSPCILLAPEPWEDGLDTQPWAHLHAPMFAGGRWVLCSRSCWG
jgi:hypothetical protein